MDSFTEVTHEGWFSRLRDSLKGVLVGIVLFAIAFPLLFWNEGRSVRRAQDLAEGRGAVVAAPGDPVVPANEGKLVHVTGEAATSDVLNDPEFGLSVNAIKLLRTAEMYQWVEDAEEETKKKLGGGKTTETTYTYEKEWANSAISSSEFKISAGHENPGTMPFESKTFSAQTVTLGAHLLNSSQVRDIAGATSLKEALPAPSGTLQTTSSGYYQPGALGGREAAPQVGDTRVSFQAVYPTNISVIAQQVGNGFQALRTGTGQELILQEMGVRTADEMFTSAEESNVLLTWGIRLGGWLLMTIGLALIFSPLVVVADVVPLIGSIVGLGTGVASAGISLVCTLFTIALGWLWYRPLIGVPLVMASVGLLVAMIVMGSKKKKARVAAVGK